MKKLLQSFEKTGTIAGGSKDQSIAIKTFNWIMLSAFFAGGIWAILLYYLEQKTAILFPLASCLFIPTLFVLFHLTKKFILVLNLFLILMLSLPALVQIFHGGFVNSGAVIAWSVIAPMMSLAFRPAKSAIRCFFTFIVLIIVTVLVELFIPIPHLKMSNAVILGQFTFNLIGVLTISFLPLLGFSKEFMKTRKLLKIKNKETKDSINYANRIQTALLPSQESIIQYFNQKSFILFQPKDKVGGDFYWKHEEGDEIILACSDCTGHGIPGAFMTFIGINNLNYIVKENGIKDPAEILEQLNQRVVSSLKSRNENLRDGMDIGICRINLKKKTLHYSSAMSKLYFYDGNKVITLHSEKRSIGDSVRQQPFITHTLNFETGQALYLSTDGYIDQFGGPRDKKFKSSQLIALLNNIAMETPKLQLKELEKAFYEWKGDFEQIDDVTIIGIQF